MAKRKDLTNQKFNRLTALSWESIKTGTKARIYWLCKCDCGNTTKVVTDHLVAGRIKSCGCFKEEVDHQRFLKHGHNVRSEGTTKIYRAWRAMLDRCTLESSPSYENYGGRGISVCDSWRTFENFLHDLGEPPSEEHTLDRIDSNGNYEPCNCRWATKIEQANNTNRNHILEFRGEKKTLAEWSKHTGINYKALCDRIYRGWSVEKALTEPVLVNSF